MRKENSGKKPIRVLQVLASLDRGGAETIVMNLYRNINREKMQFDFVVNERTNEYAYEIKALGGRVFRVPRYTLFNHHHYRRTWKELLCQHPEWEIVHGHHTSPAFVYLSVANNLGRVTIAHSHTAGGESSIKTYLKVISRYPLRYIARYLFACSNSAAKWMFGRKSIVTHILHNAIDAEKFRYSQIVRNEVRHKVGLEGKFVIGNVGRLNVPKNHTFLIDIFKKVHEQCPNSILLLIGDGSLRSTIEKKVVQLGLSDYVVFLGSRSDVPELLNAIDVFLFPSLYEGLPLSVIESQAAGLPSVVSEAIPEEAYITDLIEKEYLSSSSTDWAKRVLKYRGGYERLDTSDLIKSRGFDIFQTAAWLQHFYHGLCNNHSNVHMKQIA